MVRSVGMRVVVATALAIVAALPFAVPGGVVAGDAKVAETLFKSGKAAYAKGDYAGALSFFRSAQEESPELIEACWWKAASQEKAGSHGQALASYREFVVLHNLKDVVVVTKEEQRLRGLADKSIETLAAGEREAAKLDDAFVAALLQFAKDNFVRDPGVSVRAIERLLLVRPEHEEALQLREKLGGAPAGEVAGAAGAPVPATGPFRDVKEWRDLIADKSFRSKDLVTTPEGVLTVDAPAGLRSKPRNFVDHGASFAFEAEFRVTPYKDDWFAGLCFARKAERCISALAFRGRVAVWDTTSADAVQTLSAFDMKPIDTAGWHRIGIIVKGPNVDVWFDGKKATTWRDPSGADLVGDIGIQCQHTRIEWRLLRIGKVD